MSQPDASATLARLEQLSTCTVANAIETLRLRLRNEGFTHHSLRNFGGGPRSLVAHAVTVRIRCSTPSTDGHDYLESPAWWNYLLSVPWPRIVAIQDVDHAPGTGSLVGGVHANIFRALGCIGVVTNGTVRDLPTLAALGFHTYASGLAVSHAYAHIVDMGNPIEIAGLPIASGELLHGDLHGLISIPPDSSSRIVQAAEAMLERERRIVALCQRGLSNLETLRQAIREPDDFPR